MSQGSFERFKTFVENKGDRVEGWPGEIPAKSDAGQVDADPKPHSAR